MTQAWPGETPSSGAKQLDRRAAAGGGSSAGRGSRVERTRTATSSPSRADRRERAVAEPVHVREPDAAGRQRLARADDHLRRVGVEPDDVERLADRDAEAAALADGVVDDALVAAEHAAVEMDDLAGPRRAGRSRSMTSV